MMECMIQYSNVGSQSHKCCSVTPLVCGASLAKFPDGGGNQRHGGILPWSRGVVDCAVRYGPVDHRMFYHVNYLPALSFTAHQHYIYIEIIRTSSMFVVLEQRM